MALLHFLNKNKPPRCFARACFLLYAPEICCMRHQHRSRSKHIIHPFAAIVNKNAPQLTPGSICMQVLAYIHHLKTGVCRALCSLFFRLFIHIVRIS